MDICDMLVDPNEIAIAANAKQKNVRDPRRSRQHFFNIIEDFFGGVSLGGRFIDLGPGQFDFGEIVRERGGSCVGVDFDPAIIELGRYKGFDVIELNIQRIAEYDFGEQFDGLFNKFTLNAFWNWSDEAAHELLIKAIDDLVKPSGWVWIGPWNGVPKRLDLDQSAIEAVLAYQRRCFEALGYRTCPLPTEQSARYGIHGNVANNVVFTRNLDWRHRK